MWADISPDMTIIARAQQTVDRWLRDAHPGAFEVEVGRATNLFWDERPANAANREAFQEVADAIRRGHGHAFRNREPLLHITRQLLSN